MPWPRRDLSMTRISSRNDRVGDDSRLAQHADVPSLTRAVLPSAPVVMNNRP